MCSLGHHNKIDHAIYNYFKPSFWIKQETLSKPKEPLHANSLDYQEEGMLIKRMGRKLDEFRT